MWCFVQNHLGCLILGKLDRRHENFVVLITQDNIGIFKYRDDHYRDVQLSSVNSEQLFQSPKDPQPFRNFTVHLINMNMPFQSEKRNSFWNPKTLPFQSRSLKF